MNHPHKHTKLIAAWADGAKIQIKHNITGQWIPIKSPFWDEDREYRIAPEPQILKGYAYVSYNDRNWIFSTTNRVGIIQQKAILIIYPDE